MILFGRILINIKLVFQIETINIFNFHLLSDNNAIFSQSSKKEFDIRARRFTRIFKPLLSIVEAVFAFWLIFVFYKDQWSHITSLIE